MNVEKSDVFPVLVEWYGGRLTHARTAAGQSLEIATPPVFPEGMEGFWSPEDMLVGAAASCFILTLVSACTARHIPLHELRVNGVGRVGKRADGRFGFQSIELKVTAETPSERLEQLTALARRVERNCIVATALEVPLHVELDLRSSDSLAVV